MIYLNFSDPYSAGNPLLDFYQQYAAAAGTFPSAAGGFPPSAAVTQASALVPVTQTAHLLQPGGGAAMGNGGAAGATANGIDTSTAPQAPLTGSHLCTPYSS